MSKSKKTAAEKCKAARVGARAEISKRDFPQQLRKKTMNTKTTNPLDKHLDAILRAALSAAVAELVPVSIAPALTTERDALTARVKAIEDREALLAGSEESIPLKPASAHKLEGNAAAAYEQCRVMMALCTLLSLHYQCNALAILECTHHPEHHLVAEMVGKSSAQFMELIGDHLNACDGVDGYVADWVDPIFEKAQEIWPDNSEELSDEQIDAAQEAAYRELQKTGFNGSMGGFIWDRASARAVIAAYRALR